MSKLLQGTIVDFCDGTKGKVLEELGSGGQGTVYLVEREGEKYALKWYHKCPSIAMIDNMKENIKMGSPSKEFLWPITDTTQSYGSYGYLMHLCPKSYKGYVKFILGGANSIGCVSEEVQINAAINICSAFQKLHLKGLSYQDLNDGNFFINPQTGDVLIGDNDNAAPDKTNISCIRGKCRYMAPEIVGTNNAKGSDPDKFSDYFSLAVILFKFFFLDHPLEGKFNQSCPCLSEKFERVLYGERPVFIFDPYDKSNEATNYNSNAIKRWPLAPNILRNAFIHAFSNESLHNPTRRMSERDWIKALVEYRSSLCVCPTCNQLTYIEKEDQGRCKECKRQRDIFWMAIASYRIPLVPNQKLYACHTESNINYKDVTAVVVRNAKDSSKFGLHNLSKYDWILECNHPDTGEKINKVIKKGETAPIINGGTIKFGNIAIGKIKLIVH